MLRASTPTINILPCLPCIYTLELKLVHVYSRVATSVELELSFPLANRGRTRMGEEDNDHESDVDIVFLHAGIGRHWATTKEN